MLRSRLKTVDKDAVQTDAPAGGRTQHEAANVSSSKASSSLPGEQ